MFFWLPLVAPSLTRRGALPLPPPPHLQDFLSPWEQQLVDQINAMNVPVHVEVRRQFGGAGGRGQESCDVLRWWRCKLMMG